MGVPRVDVPDHAHARVVGQHAGNARGGFIGALANNDHPGMLGVAHADPAAMIQRYPGRAADGVTQRVQQQPVGYGD